MKPFLKWAGGKYKLVNIIKEQLPIGNTFIEPFAGGGSVFLNVDYDSFIVNDINNDLISMYNLIKADSRLFINEAKKLFTEQYNTPEMYYSLRDKFNTLPYNFERAILFLYFNRHGYNGLCRYNLSGGFNVPFGKYKKPYFPEKELEYFAFKSQFVEFKNDDFRNIMKLAKSGDVIYCDPPYVPLSDTSNFTTYSSDGFTEKDQQDLVSLANDLNKNNVTVIISNHLTLDTLELYKDAEIIEFDVQRNISCKGDNRNKVGELLAVYRPEKVMCYE